MLLQGVISYTARTFLKVVVALSVGLALFSTGPLLGNTYMRCTPFRCSSGLKAQGLIKLFFKCFRLFNPFFALYFGVVSMAASVLASGAYAVPLAQDDFRQAPQNTPVIIDVLSNDTGQGALTLVAFSQPAADVAVVALGAGGGLRVLPHPSFWGVLIFNYQISDDSGQTSNAQVRLDITRTQTVTSVVADALPMQVATQLATESLMSHSRALEQFKRTRQNQNMQGRWVYRGLPAGGAAGDEVLGLGGVFISLDTADADHLSLTPVAQTTRSYNATAGADFNVTKQWLVGGALGATTANTQSDEGQALFDFTEQSLLGFVSYRNNAVLGELQLGFSRNNLSHKGGGAFNSTAQTANFDVSGQSRFALAKLEYALNWQGWQLLPGVNLQYQYAQTEAFNALKPAASAYYSAQSNQLWAGAFSLYSDYAWGVSWGVLLPQLTLVSRYGLDKGDSWSDGSSLRVNGEAFALPASAHDSHELSIDAGIALMFTHGFSGFINYHRLTQNRYYAVQSFQAGMRWEF